MGKIIGSILILTALILVLFSIFKNKIGDIRPAILPPTKQSINPANLPLTLSDGYTIGYYIQNLGDVRDLEFSPRGTLLASLTSEGKILSLKGKDNKVNAIKEILINLKNPHGIAFYNNKLYVAEETQLSRYNWDEQNLKATLDKVLFKIPAGGNHFTRSIVFDKSGRLYLSIGSTCNVCVESNPWHGAVISSDADGNNPEIFSSGLRNSVFLTLNSKTNQIWATDMGRDNLGDDIPPDEINILEQGKNYGWPNCYGDRVPDLTFNKDAKCEDTVAPIYKIQAHSAPLGLTFINSTQFPSDWQGDLLVAYHGSWNRSVPTGYKVVHMKVKGDTIISEEDFITGFLQGSETIGRPVDVIFDKQGYLYISDDKTGSIYIVGKK